MVKSPKKGSPTRQGGLVEVPILVDKEDHPARLRIRRFPRAEFVWLSSRNDDGVARRRRGVVAANGNEDSSLARRVQRGEELARLLRREAAVSSGRTIPSQDGDAALALRLQRQEFMEGFRETEQGPGRRLLSARENWRAMASRAVNVRSRVQHL
ncbi:hypothetical protein LINPERHAP1_LOCUS20741 [Linum perenne]